MGAAAQNASALTMTDGAITVNANSTTANRGRAVLASSNGAVTLNNVAIATAGTNNYGAQASSGGSIALNGGSLNANGMGNAALYVNNNGTIIANDMTIVTSGQNAYGLYALFAGSGAASTINITGGSIEANNATAIVSNNTTLNTTLTNTTVSGNNALLEAINNGIINLETHQSTLNGPALLDAASNASSSLSLFDSSTWNVSDNSQVTNLVNDASTIHFTLPVSGAYKRLIATNYSGNNGTIELNTLLHDSNSPSDLVVINTNGSATGTTNLVIRNTTGAGAATEGNGILVVDALTGATTTQTAFSLATPAVAGPFEYSLYRSGVDGDNQDNWYLRSLCPLTNPLCSSEPPNPPMPTPMDYRVETKIYSTLAATTVAC